MHKLKSAKGALKDYNHWIADELEDYAEIPENSDPISHITKFDIPNIQILPQKQKYTQSVPKTSSNYPKYNPDFNLQAASQGIFDGKFGDLLARFLPRLDIIRLLSTCRYLNQTFSRSSVWQHNSIKSYGYSLMSVDAFQSINAGQFYRHFRYMRSDGIIFDTIRFGKEMRDEEKPLVANIVDFVRISNEKTIEVVKMMGLKGTFTEDVKISWLKETNEIYVWIASYQVQKSKKLASFANVIFAKEYKEKIKEVFFLNDQYFVVELELRDEVDGCNRTFEIFELELESNWFEKKNIFTCQQILKESFNMEEKGNSLIKVKNIGDFLIFIIGSHEELLVKIFDAKEGKVIYESEKLLLDSSLHDVILSKASLKEEDFNLYVLDQKLEVYVLNFAVDSGITMKKIEVKKPEEEEKKEFELNGNSISQQKRFPDNMKKYHYDIITVKDKQGQSERLEYLVLNKQNQFFLIKLSSPTIQVTPIDLSEVYFESFLSNWTVYKDYIYLLEETRIHIYKINFEDGSSALHKEEFFIKTSIRKNDALWILVNPCITAVVSVRQPLEQHMDSIRVFSGSTEKLLLHKSFAYEDWACDELLLGNMLNHLDKWQDISELGEERFEWKLENERLLVKTHLRSYFRDFNVCEKRVDRNLYKWKELVNYDFRELNVIGASEGGKDKKVKMVVKESSGTEIRENRNHEISGKKKQSNNWKNVEKKEVTEEKEERKQNKKKGDKYFKNVRQNKHSQKMSN